MPPALKSKQLFWSGIALLAVAAVLLLFLDGWIYSAIGDNAGNFNWLFTASALIKQLALTLGATVLAVSPIARTLELHSRATAPSEDLRQHVQ